MLIHPSIAEKHDGYLRKHAETGENIIVGAVGRHLIGLHANGSSFTVALSVEEESIGGRTTYHGSLRALFEIDGLLVADMDGRITSANAGICSIFGYRQSEVRDS